MASNGYDNKANTEISLDGIQNQINYCDEIVDLVDKIVPKLYKVRQQALAQKEYINDITRKLLTTGMDSTTGFEAKNIANKKIVFADDSLGTTLVGDTWKDVSFKPSVQTVSEQLNVFNNTKEQRQVIQSLFKYKHDVGTENHFTTDQTGVAADRTHGLNLSDVKTLLTGINGLMKQSNSSPTTASSDLKNILLKNIEKLDETDTRVETLSVIPQDDANTTVSKILISEKAGSYQTKLSTKEGAKFKIEYLNQDITPTAERPSQTPAESGINNNVTVPAVSAANYRARDAQYLAVADNKCEPASLFETIPDLTQLTTKTSLDVTKTQKLSDSIKTGIDLGVELADPWSSRHKYVGFGLGD